MKLIFTSFALRIVTPITHDVVAIPIKPSMTRNNTNRFDENHLQRNSDRLPTLSRIKTNKIATAK
jgi:hypothetical protein